MAVPHTIVFPIPHMKPDISEKWSHENNSSVFSQVTLEYSFESCANIYNEVTLNPDHRHILKHLNQYSLAWNKQVEML